jgi:glycosyltransferase involved in cell wall biosynthesis
MNQPKIGFLTFDFHWGTDPLQPNGCAWYRCYLPMQELRKFNWQTSLGYPGFHEEYGLSILIPDKKVLAGWDIVVLKLVMLESVIKKIPQAQALGQKVVIDVDDFHEGLSPTNKAFHSTDPKNNSRNNRDHYFKGMELADALITSTPFLYSFYKSKYPNKPIYLIRNAVDLQFFNKRKDVSGFYPTVGWVGATSWRSQDLETLNSFLNNYLIKNNMRFHHSGQITNELPTAAEQLKISKNIYSAQKPTPILDYGAQMFKKIDIGIVPLNVIDFNKAKSFIKGLEYSASGIPFIAQNIDEYKFLYEEFDIGKVASNEDEWIFYLDYFKNEKNRKKEVEKNYELVKKFHTMNVRGLEWDKVYKEILSL